MNQLKILDWFNPLKINVESRMRKQYMKHCYLILFVISHKYNPDNIYNKLKHNNSISKNENKYTENNSR